MVTRSRGRVLRVVHKNARWSGLYQSTMWTELYTKTPCAQGFKQKLCVVKAVPKHHVNHVVRVVDKDGMCSGLCHCTMMSGLYQRSTRSGLAQSTTYMNIW